MFRFHVCTYVCIYICMYTSSISHRTPRAPGAQPPHPAALRKAASAQRPAASAQQPPPSSCDPHSPRSKQAAQAKAQRDLRCTRGLPAKPEAF